jgi:hypothetical protein
VIKKSRAKVPVNPYRSTTSPDDLGPADRIAFDIVAERRDLLPSVDRIMNADLEVEARVRAITLFRDSLTRMGDPHRDPRVAIMKSTSTARRSTAAARTT